MKSIRATLLAIALAPLLSEGAFLDDLEAKSNRTEGSPFATGGDIILKISSREYVHIFTNVNTESTFQLTERSIARILCVGGGGPGGRCNRDVPGGGGGAGGFVEKNDVMLTAGTYAIEVGKGGVPSAAGVLNDSGKESAVKRGGTDIVRAHGGGGGGTPSSWGALGDYETDSRYGRHGASGGGGCAWDYTDTKGIGGKALYEGAEGKRGGLAKVATAAGNNKTAAGGGGAGQDGYNNDDPTYPCKGGDGKLCDITGEELWYAGGGAGGFKYESSLNNNSAGGLGGGGSVKIDSAIAATDAVRGTGGGGYGGTYHRDADIRVGNGADGIVIVRVVRAAEGFKVIVR